MKCFNWLISRGLRGNHNFLRLIWLYTSDMETK